VEVEKRGGGEIGCFEDLWDKLVAYVKGKLDLIGGLRVVVR